MIGRLAPLLLPFLWPAHRRLQAALSDPERAQREALARMGRRLQRARYAQSVRADFSDYEAFARSTPLCTFEDVAPFIEAQRQGEADVLCPGPVSAYEPTSGSAGAKKWIPYNPALLAVFRRMFAAWVFDIVRHGPGFSSAKFYFSVSPSFDDAGLDDDRAYMSWFFRLVLGRFFVLPQDIAQERDHDRFLRRTAAALLAEPRLEIVSVWSPTFLTAVLDRAREDYDAVAPLMREEWRASAARVEVVGAALQAGDWSSVWPDLRLLSCWDRAFAATGAERLRGFFPETVVQGKGLLLTEGPVTIPSCRAEGPGQVPLADGVVLEFLNDAGDVLPLWRLRDGDAYELVLTQPAGLLRYRTGDRVVATGRFGQTSGLSFIGRVDRRVDLVGEKLSESFAAEVMAGLGIQGSLCVAPDESGYVLLTADEGWRGRGLQIDVALCAAHHYGLARKLGQLAPVRVQVVEDVSGTLLGAWTAQGKKAGDFKPGPLCAVPVASDVVDRGSVRAVEVNS